MMINENVYRWISLVLTIASLGISITFRYKARVSDEKVSSKEEGKEMFILRTIFGLGMWLSVLVYFINPRWLSWAQYPIPWILRASALVIMSICVPGLFWLFSNLGKNITQTVAIRKQHTLVTNGPYKYIRHPLYTIGFIFFISLSIVAANWFIQVLMVIGYLVILARTPIEEKKLIERFGDDYIQYMSTTGRYFPRFR